MTDETEPSHSNGRVWFEEGLGDIRQDMGSKRHTLLLQVSNASVQNSLWSFLQCISLLIIFNTICISTLAKVPESFSVSQVAQNVENLQQPECTGQNALGCTRRLNTPAVG